MQNQKLKSKKFKPKDEKFKMNFIEKITLNPM